MSAAALLAEASVAGVTLRLADGKVKVGGDASAEFLTRLRAHKAGLIELLHGERCRSCGERMAWPGPAGVIFGDGTAECCSCTDAEAARLYAAAKRVVTGVVGVSDESEFLRAGGEP